MCVCVWGGDRRDGLAVFDVCNCKSVKRRGGGGGGVSWGGVSSLTSCQQGSSYKGRETVDRAASCFSRVVYV